MKATVLVPAAGMGRRMGTTLSKQYLNLNGRPILAHTLSLFDNHPLVEHIYPILPPDELDYCRENILAPGGFGKIRRLVPGGLERQDSVRNGLKAMREDDLDQPERVVLIHDGVRPLFNPAMIAELVALIQEQGACVVGVPAKDTIKQVENNQIRSTPDRRALWLAQTPQGFQYRLIDEAFSYADARGYRATDDAALLELMGQPVAMLKGDYRNIKVTTPEDLVIATALLDSLREESA